VASTPSSRMRPISTATLSTPIVYLFHSTGFSRQRRWQRRRGWRQLDRTRARRANMPRPDEQEPGQRAVSAGALAHTGAACGARGAGHPKPGTWASEARDRS
jgi:hypothetical protein